MEVFFGLILDFLIIYFLYKFFKKKKFSNLQKHTNKENYINNHLNYSKTCHELSEISFVSDISEFTKRSSLTTNCERVFLVELKKAFGGKYDIYPQIHLGAIFRPRSKYGNWGQLSRLNKRIDFLLVNKIYQTPILGIELDDNSHEDEEGEFTVSGYNHEYTDDGYRKDIRFEGCTFSEELKGKPLDFKIFKLMNNAILATNGIKEFDKNNF